MKTKRVLVLGLLVLARGAWAQPITEPGWFEANQWPRTVSLPDENAAQGSRLFTPEGESGLEDGQPVEAVAEAITPEIQALAEGLGNDPVRIFNYVHDHIRHVLYFGSKKGAQLTLFERSGNDFDQCALLVALLRAAGYNDAHYQFGWMMLHYDSEDQSHRDLRHWLELSLVNTNWLATSNYLSDLFLQVRGYPTYAAYWGTNTWAFQRVWVRLSLGGTNYYLDPAFKVSEPIAGLTNLATAMGFSSNGLMTAAAGTDTGNYVTNLNEAALRGTLTGYTTNLLNYLLSNCPNAAVEEVLSGWRIVPATNTALSRSTSFPTYEWGGLMPIANWVNQPTNLMATMAITFAGTNHQWLVPQLQGQRLTLAFDTNGVAQLWQEDNLLVEKATGGTSSSTNVVLSINHPNGSWNFANNTFVDSTNGDQSVTTSYHRTNATYNLLYAFEPDWRWLEARQRQLADYREQGLADNSREVVSETLNIMGLNWQLQSEWVGRMLASQLDTTSQFYHRMGRMAQEGGKGYYVDAYMMIVGMFSKGGNDAANRDRTDRYIDLFSYWASALEHGLIEQLQSSNLVAASTVKLLQLASTNGQAIYLASSNNWTAGYNVRSKLINYTNLTKLDGYINSGYYLLLPRNGSNQVAGTGSWAGYGFVARGPVGRLLSIGGDYFGGHVAYPWATIDPPAVDLFGYSQPQYFNPSSPLVPFGTGADPVDMVDGSFRLNVTDLSLGGSEPRGLTLSRHYNPTRLHHNLAGMASGWVHNYHVTVAEIAAPQAGLGETTPAQMVPMLVASASAIGIYNDLQRTPKNWMVTALIAKWGVDQLTKNGVSVSLGEDTIQFIRQPDGSFTPPAGNTMTLLKTNSAYQLQERHGNTFKFDATGRLTNLVDPYNRGLTVTYNSSNCVGTVTDWTNRTLTFNYTGTPARLTSVTDGARTVAYSYSTAYNNAGDLTAVTDPENKTSTFLYDNDHQIIATVNALGRTVTSNRFDGFGRVIEQYSQGDPNQAWRFFWSEYENIEEDPAGGQRHFFYDDLHRLTGVQDALGHLSRTFYDGQDHVVLTVSPLNETNRFEYDGRHNLLRAIDPRGFTNQFFYDAHDRLTGSVDARGNTNQFGYNAQHSLTGRTNGAGDWVAFTYNADGTLATRADPGGTTSYGYDTYGQLNHITHPGNLGSEGFLNSAWGDVLSRTNGRGFVTSFQYNARRELTNTIAPTNLTTKVAYDAVGNVQSTTDARGFTTTNTWSATRKLLITALPPTPQGTPIITNGYDARDWLTRAVNPLQQATLFTNDAAQRLISTTDPLNRTVRFGYDDDGRNLATTNAANEVTRQEWTARGELAKSADGANRTVLRAYDAAGNQVNLTNRNGKRWQFQYDAANRLTNTISPRNRQTKQVWNDRGLLQSVIEPSTDTANFYYDAKGRLTNRVDDVASTAYRYDANDNVTNVVENGKTNAWTYDAYDRVSSYRDADGNLIQYRYDANGNLTNLVYPGNRAVAYAYDSLNRLTNVTDWANRKTTFVYDLASRLRAIIRPNGTSRTIGYDAAGQATNLWEKMALGVPIAYFKLNWNSAGRVAWEFAAPLPHTNALPARTMTFDDDNRLATFNGNNVSHDADGNLTYGPGTNNTFITYSYDARNRLVGTTSTSSLTYSYDPAGHRTAITNGGEVTRLVINPNAPLSQVLMRIKGGVTNYYVYGLGLLYEVTETATSTNTLTYHYDYRGSTVALSGDNGVVTGDRIEYSAYGSITYRAGTNDTPFLYNGRYGVQTDANGLLYLRARYYNPYLCRFLNPDPIGFSGGMNFYAAFDGNPISLVDPFGLSTWTRVGGFGRMVAGGLETAVGYTFAVASGTAAVGTSPTVAGAVGFGALAVGGAAVGAHGVDTFQAGARQFWTGEHVDSLTSQNLQAAGMSPRAANLTDAGIGVVGTLGAGLATAPIRASTIAATDPLAQGLNSGEILSMWETGSRAVNAADWAVLGGQVAPEAALYRALLMENGINMSGQAYQLTTTGLERLGQSILLAPTGLTPAAAQGAGYLGSGLNAVNGAVDWFGRPISNGGK